MPLVEISERIMFMSRIYVTGDTHRTIDIGKLRTFSAMHTDLNKNDYVIIAGDFGALWNGYGSIRDNRVLDIYDSFPWTTLWIDGNHENFNQINRYPVSEWNGGSVHIINQSVIHLMRGQVYTIDGLKFFTMGGAVSIDKMWRTEDISWWKDELPSEKEYKTAIKNLENNDMSVDYIITHCCSRSRLKKTLPCTVKYDELNDWFTSLEKNKALKYKHWYYGHYHVDKKVDKKHTCLYNEIVEIK